MSRYFGCNGDLLHCYVLRLLLGGDLPSDSSLASICMQSLTPYMLASIPSSGLSGSASTAASSLSESSSPSDVSDSSRSRGRLWPANFFGDQSMVDAGSPLPSTGVAISSTSSSAVAAVAAFDGWTICLWLSNLRSVYLPPLSSVWLLFRSGSSWIFGDVGDAAHYSPRFRSRLLFAGLICSWWPLSLLQEQLHWTASHHSRC